MKTTRGNIIKVIKKINEALETEREVGCFVEIEKGSKPRTYQVLLEDYEAEIEIDILKGLSIKDAREWEDIVDTYLPFSENPALHKLIIDLINFYNKNK